MECPVSVRILHSGLTRSHRSSVVMVCGGGGVSKLFLTLLAGPQ